MARERRLAARAAERPAERGHVAVADRLGNAGERQGRHRQQPRRLVHARRLKVARGGRTEVLPEERVKPRGAPATRPGDLPHRQGTREPVIDHASCAPHAVRQRAVRRAFRTQQLEQELAGRYRDRVGEHGAVGARDEEVDVAAHIRHDRHERTRVAPRSAYRRAGHGVEGDVEHEEARPYRSCLANRRTCLRTPSTSSR